MKRAAIQIAVLAAALILICLICRFAFFNSYIVYIPMNSDQTCEYDLRFSEPGIVGIDEKKENKEYMEIFLKPEGIGNTFLEIVDPQGKVMTSIYIRANRHGTIMDLSSGGFTGDSAVLIAVSLFFIIISAIMLYNYLDMKGPEYYSYLTVYFAGFFFFALYTGITVGQITVMHIIRPDVYNLITAYSAINGSSMRFMRITMLPVLLFSLAMIISNIVLLKYERTKLNNLLGIITGIALIAGEAIGIYFRLRFFSGSEWEYRVNNTIENVYATIFVYFECMLAGAVICGITAAHHTPPEDRDYIIILGCYFRKDGSLTPLLQGRVDAAVSFWKRQYEHSGRKAVFITSGGKGVDEPMPEAVAMRNYLNTCGIPDDLILMESNSRNTYENMRNSAIIIQQLSNNAKIAYATTKYHVFRSGVWANMAGLKAEGIGSKTKWWYWPNAFMRECAGLLSRRWKTELLFLLVLIVFFGILSMVLY